MVVKIKWPDPQLLQPFSVSINITVTVAVAVNGGPALADVVKTCPWAEALRAQVAAVAAICRLLVVSS